MTTKTDLASLTLSPAERAAMHAKAVNGDQLIIAAKQAAADLANQLGEVVKFIPAGANATTLTAIRAALL